VEAARRRLETYEGRQDLDDDTVAKAEIAKANARITLVG
jgi:hypothetical protein